MYLMANGTLREIKRAPRREMDPPPMEFIAMLIRRTVNDLVLETSG